MVGQDNNMFEKLHPVYRLLGIHSLLAPTVEGTAKTITKAPTTYCRFGTKDGLMGFFFAEFP